LAVPRGLAFALGDGNDEGDGPNQAFAPGNSSGAEEAFAQDGDPDEAFAPDDPDEAFAPDEAFSQGGPNQAFNLEEAFSSGMTPHYAFSLDEAFAAENELQKCVLGSYTLEFSSEGECDEERVFAAFLETIVPMMDMVGCNHSPEVEFRIHMGIGLNDDEQNDSNGYTADDSDGPQQAFRKLVDGPILSSGPQQAFTQDNGGGTDESGNGDEPEEAFSSENAGNGGGTDEPDDGDEPEEAFNSENAFNSDNADNAFAFSEPAAVTTEEAVKRICRTAWSSNPQFPFTMAARQKNPNFEQVYYNGGTDWNEQVEMNPEEGTGNGPRHLRNDAANVKSFYEGLAQTAQVQWPDYLTNFKQETCSTNTAYCCWPKDRQAGDGNGNCAKPYDTKCVDSDPSDNTDLCYMDLSRNDGFAGSGSVFYPGDNADGEGSIHCHGFAWSNDEGHPSARYKANNLFFVSMYDHMHQRGYVKNTPGAPMCACADQMPTVSRSDCTQIEVQETYKLTYDATVKQFTGEISQIEIDFESCKGFDNTNNNLAAYVTRMTRENHINSDQRHDLMKYIVGDNRCDMVRKHYINDKYELKLGYNPGPQWTLLVGRDTFEFNAITTSLFKLLYEEAPFKIIYRVCPNCDDPYKHVYYRRNSDVPANYDLFHSLKNDWTHHNTYEKNNQDFNLYSTFAEAVDEQNPWTRISQKGNKGMPGNSGPDAANCNTHMSTNFQSGYGRRDVAMYIMADPSRSAPIIQRIVEVGTNINHGSGAGGAATLTTEGQYLINAVGMDMWGTEDSFYFLNQEGQGDITLIVHVVSFVLVDQWTKVGLQIRDRLGKRSKNAACLISGKWGVVYQSRSESGGSTTISSPKRSDKLNVWLKLTKNANEYSCYYRYTEEEPWTSAGSSHIEMDAFQGTHQYGMAAATHKWGTSMEVIMEDYSIDTLGDFGGDYENLNDNMKTNATDAIFQNLKDAINDTYVPPVLP